MGFMDGLKKLTQPYDDDEDFFEGADQSFRPQPKAEQKPAVSAAQMTFENSFADTSGGPAPAEEAQPKKQGEGGGIFGGLKKAASGGKPRRERTMNFGGKDTSVILFSPKSFDEAGELVSYLQQELTCVMTLESVPADTPAGLPVRHRLRPGRQDHAGFRKNVFHYPAECRYRGHTASPGPPAGELRTLFLT